MKKLTKYNEIALSLKDDIASGKYGIGSLLPTEFELSAMYSASRQTVRSAIAELARQGFVSRTKKLGTRVESALPQNMYLHRLDSINDLVQFSNENKKVVQAIEQIVLDKQLAAELGLEPGLHALKISTMRYGKAGDKLPIGWTDIYVVLADLDLALLADRIRAKPDVLVSVILEEEFNVTLKAVRQEIDSMLLPQALEAVLQTPSPAPALKVIRRYIDRNDDVVEVSITLHPGGRFSLLLDAKREM
ncbi:MAG TPA: GntR family transcriptional regulator [Advenella sp.]|nr:GntR family transcriptional regulator [Advenella sp.]